jgi:hypothetical protein
VVVTVTADAHPRRRDAGCNVRVGQRPSTLDEAERGHHGTFQDIQDALHDARHGGPVRVLDIDRQRDPNGPGGMHVGYFSTPVMTTPLVNAFWNTRKRSTGTTIVMSVPAWMSAGSREWMPLKRARPTASGWRSVLVER